MPRYFKILTKSYVILFAIFLVFRIISTFMIWKNISTESSTDILYAYFMGWRFDNIIICALLVLPTLIMGMNQYIFKSQKIQRLAFWPIYILIPIIVVLQIIDVLYFDFFKVRITSAILNYADDLAFTIKMVKDEPAWLIGMLAMPPFMWGLTLPFRKLNEKNYWQPLIGASKFLTAISTVFLLAVYFLGIRGRVAIKSPIREGTAYFSPNPTLNNLALNPTYTFFASWARARKYKQKHLKFMSPEEADQTFQKAYSYSPQIGMNPLTRQIEAGIRKDWNVVLIIMESMSAYYSDYYQNPSWTPELDKLKNEGWNFQHAFSAGMHTYNGVWSTLFSYPAPFTSHPLKRDNIPAFNSFATQLTKAGVETFFFTTHDDQFDNMAGFVRQNGFKNVIHQADYPQDRVFSILGVPDHDMFDHSLPLFAQADKKSRFFAAFLTGSNHKPHIIPPELKSQFDGPVEKENIVRYSDWAIGRFILESMKQDWGKRTIFAFIADHGQSIGTTPVDQIMSYHLVPFIIWSPLLKPKKISEPVMQVDVMPTLMELIGGKWLNSTFGTSAISNPRSWAYVGRDSSTCLITGDTVDCEDQDKHHDLHHFSNPLWTSGSESSDIWKQIHAELQISDTILRERQNFP